MGGDDCDDDDIKTKRMKLLDTGHESLSINELNDECFLEIFSYLSIADIIHVEEVCRRWRGLCPKSWKHVESLQCRENGCFFMQKSFDCVLYEVTCLNDLHRILKSCGDFIKYFHLSCRCSTKSPTLISSLSIVPQLCNNLQHVEIDLSNPLSIDEIRSLMDNCRNLEKLIITRIDREYEKELSELLRNNEKLKHFSLGSEYWSSNMSGKFLESLPANVIEEIDLKRCENLKSQFFISAMKKFDRLQSFTHGPSGYFDDSMVELIGRKETLKKLSMICASYKSLRSIHHLANLVNLEELILSCNYQLRDDVLINISNNCQQLKLLEISFCSSITDRGIESITKLNKLEILKMDGLDEVTDAPIGNLPKSLTILICSICERVKDRGVKRFIRRAPNLKQLNLYLCSVTNSTIETAIHVTRRRTNGVVLQINVEETMTNLADITETSPYLQIFK